MNESEYISTISKASKQPFISLARFSLQLQVNKKEFNKKKRKKKFKEIILIRKALAMIREMEMEREGKASYSDSRFK